LKKSPKFFFKKVAKTVAQQKMTKFKIQKHLLQPPLGTLNTYTSMLILGEKISQKCHPFLCALHLSKKITIGEKSPNLFTLYRPKNLQNNYFFKMLPGGRTRASRSPPTWRARRSTSSWASPSSATTLSPHPGGSLIKLVSSLPMLISGRLWSYR
jgi:hypothetical protein